MTKEMTTITLSDSILIRIARLDINQDAITFDECITNLLKIVEEQDVVYDE